MASAYYTIDLYYDTTRKARIVDWLSGEYEAEYSAPSRLTLTYPGDGDWAAYMRYPYYLVLREPSGTAIDKLLIQEAVRTRGPDGQVVVTVSAIGMLGQLGSEIISYDTGESGETVSTIVAGLLALQSNGKLTAITAGTIDSAYGTQTQVRAWKHVSILSALRDLHDVVGGVLWVDIGGALQWDSAMRVDVGQHIRVEKNLPTIEETTDYSSIRTRVVAIGKGSGEDQLTSTQTNATATWGTITEVVGLPQVDDQDELDALATELVTQLSAPRRKYQIGVLDYSCFDWSEYSFDAIRLGTGIDIVDDHFRRATHTSEGATEALVVHTEVIRIRRRLEEPWDVEVEVANPDVTVNAPERAYAESLTDYLANQAMDNAGYWDNGLWADDVPELAGVEAGGWPTGVTGLGTDVQSTGSANAAGDNDAVARDDHVHTITYGIVDDITDVTFATKGAGVDWKPARGDHQHQFPPGSNIQSIGRANAAGSGTAPARDDHVHKGLRLFAVSDITASPAEGEVWTVGDIAAEDTGDGVYEIYIWVGNDSNHATEPGSWVLASQNFPEVASLPAIPTRPKIVWYDDQLWAAGPDLTEWYPLMTYTTTAGTPPG
jgi:hypothetical protein